MRPGWALILIAATQLTAAGLSQGQPAKVIGSWKVEITFGTGETRSFRLEAREAGKGTFLLVDPKLKAWGPAKPSQMTWAQAEDGSLNFSGPVEFPLGNVGRDAGTLILKGKVATDGAMKGTAVFFPADQNPKDPASRPSKSGGFKATRVTGG